MRKQVADNQELQRLIQQAKQSQDDAHAQAQIAASQEKNLRKLTIEKTFRQELERNLSIDVCRALGIQYEWVTLDSTMALATLVKGKAFARFGTEIDWDELPDHWESTCYIATMAIFRCPDQNSIHLYNYSYYTYISPHGFSLNERSRWRSFGPEKFRDGLLLCIHEMIQKGPSNGYYLPQFY